MGQRISTLIALLCGMSMSGCSSRLPEPTPDPADTVLLGRLFDARLGEVLEDGVVVIDGDRIRCAGARDACDWRDARVTQDHGHAMLLPGLIDLHVHARPHYIGAFVPAGVTTVRDAGNTLDAITAFRVAPGAPRLISAGPLLDGSDSVLASDGSWPLDPAALQRAGVVTLPSPAAADAAVDALAVAGVDWIKLYEQLAPDTFDAAVRAAARHGLPVMTDLGTQLTRGLDGAQVDAAQAAQAGVSTIEHLGGAALAYRRLGGDPAADTLDPALLDQLAGMLASTGVAMVLTVANGMQFANPDSLARNDLPGAARVAPYFAGYWSYLAGVMKPPALQARTQADRRLLEALLPRLLAAGVPVGAGSDLPAAPYMLPGAALHQELDALVDIGLSPTQALQAATYVAAEILQRNELGVLETGAQADILVVDGDPTRDIRDTRRVRAVWQHGVEVDLDTAWDDVETALRAARDADAG